MTARSHTRARNKAKRRARQRLAALDARKQLNPRKAKRGTKQQADRGGIPWARRHD